MRCRSFESFFKKYFKKFKKQNISMMCESNVIDFLNEFVKIFSKYKFEVIKDVSVDQRVK